MATETLEQLAQQHATKKRGWRWSVGIYADSPDLDEVVEIGQEWRSTDRAQGDKKGWLYENK